MHTYTHTHKGTFKKVLMLSLAHFIMYADMRISHTNVTKTSKRSRSRFVIDESVTGEPAKMTKTHSKECKCEGCTAVTLWVGCEQ